MQWTIGKHFTLQFHLTNISLRKEKIKRRQKSFGIVDDSTYVGKVWVVSWVLIPNLVIRTKIAHNNTNEFLMNADGVQEILIITSLWRKETALANSRICATHTLQTISLRQIGNINRRVLSLSWSILQVSSEVLRYTISLMLWKCVIQHYNSTQKPLFMSITGCQVWSRIKLSKIYALSKKMINKSKLI